MKRTLRHVALYAVVFATATSWSCSPDLTCDSGWCGTVVVASAPIQSLFPPNPRLDVDLGVFDLVYSKLADVGPSFNTMGDAGFLPVLASSWKSEDDLTISFDLNPGASWHDGTPVTAEDVVFTFSVYRDPIVNATARSRLSEIASVTARDSATVVFRFRSQYPEQFYDAVAHMHILPNHILENVPLEDLRSHEFARNPVGSGPYRVATWIPGEHVELVADSTHFLGRPGIPRVIWRAVAGPTAGVDEVLANRADFLHVVGEPGDLERIERAPHARLIEYPSNTYNYVGFNLRDPENESRPHPLFGNPRLRRAVVMCLDRPDLSQSVLGPYQLPSIGPVTPALWIWDENLPEGIPFDSARGAAQLNDLGWSDSDDDGVLDRDGRRFEFGLLVPPVPVRARGALILQERLRRVGIRVSIEEVEWAAWEARLTAGEFDAQYMSLGQDPSPSALATDWTEDGFDEFNYGKYSDPEYTRLVREARSDSNRSTSLAKWRAALEIINEDAPAIWLYIPRKFAAVHERFEAVTIFPYQPWRGLPDLFVPTENLIDRDLHGVN